MELETGIVKWVIPEKKGCIARANGQRDVLFDYAELKSTDELHKGQRVTFEVVNGERGPKAVSVLFL